MRNWFWYVLIAGALASIVAGFVEGNVGTHPLPVAQVRRVASAPEREPPPREAEGAPTDVAVEDPFSQDPVVVERARPESGQWQRARLQLVVGICGVSIAAESGFLRLGQPVAFIVDPRLPDATRFGDLVRASGDRLFVQASAVPSAQVLGGWRRLLSAIDGVGARDPQGMARALHGTGLAFLDERGDADPNEFLAQDVPLIRRDVTADDRGAPGYVAFMLSRAAALSQRVGPVVVFVRPLPTTLEAVQTVSSTGDVQLVSLP